MKRAWKALSLGNMASLAAVAVIAVTLIAPGVAGAQQILNSDTYIPADIARQSLFQSAADALGISEDDLLAQLTGDKTLQDVINAHGGNVAAIEQQAQQVEKDKVGALVSSGLLDKTQGDKILAGASQALDYGMTKDRTLAAAELQDRLSRQSLLQATETATNLTDTQIADLLAKGETFSQIVKDNGGNIDDVEQAAQQQFKDGVANLVKNGDLPQSQADKVNDGFDKKMDFQLRQDTTLHDRVRRDIITDHAMIDATAKSTGLTPEQVRDRLAQGKTFDEIVRNNGGNINEVQKVAGEQIRDTTQQLVKNGVIGPVQADYLTHNLDKRLDYVGHHIQHHWVIRPVRLHKVAPKVVPTKTA